MPSNQNRQKSRETWTIFEKIAHRYDLANRVLSLGIDRSWRKKVSSLIKYDKEIAVLDLATGTGDLLLTILEDHQNVTRSLGVDMSPNMLKLAETKSIEKKFYHQTSFRVGDATQLHLKDKEWDYVTIAFGIRNTYDPLVTLKEMHRVLKKDGEAIVLEFSLPKNIIFRKVYLIYFRYFLPLIGFILSGKLKAYQYLNQSVESFPYGKDFLNLMDEAGFNSCVQYPLTFGIASIYIGKK